MTTSADHRLRGLPSVDETSIGPGAAAFIAASTRFSRASKLLMA
jgi:hypothetical protein